MSSSKRKQIALTSDSMFIVWTRFINMLACDNITPLFGICIFTGGDFPPGTHCLILCNMAVYVYIYIYFYHILRYSTILLCYICSSTSQFMFVCVILRYMSLRNAILKIASWRRHSICPNCELGSYIICHAPRINSYMFHIFGCLFSVICYLSFSTTCYLLCPIF